MARLIPKISIDEISLKPERDVARALVEQLPNDCVVYHSYPWLKEERNNKNSNVNLQEGEVDFIIVIPDIGFLVLEVKGGEINYDSQNHNWFRCLPNGGFRDIKDPFEQARKNTHYLENQIVKHSFPGTSRVPGSFGYAVIFPDCSYSGEMPPGAENSIIFSVEDLPYLNRRVPDVLQRWSRRKHDLTKQELNGIVKGLSPSLKLLPVLFRKIEEQEERLFRLTNNQISVLEFLQANKQVQVEGVAGSGKTMLARAQVQRFADQGKSTLLVCFNRALSDWLENSMPEEIINNNVTILNFHRLCIMSCKEAGIPFNVNEDNPSEFWRYDAPDLLMQAIQQTDKRYDAIVVDEGQDFYPEWWIPLDELSNGFTECFYLFYDPEQNLYVGDELSLPDMGTPIKLPTNCRNTVKIAEQCSRIIETEIPVNGNSPMGDDVIVNVAETKEKQIELCKKTIKAWLGTGKLKPSQIAIQCPRSWKKSSFDEVAKIGNIPVIENVEAWKNDEGILFKTIRSFKGLEADAIVVIDIPEPGSRPYFSKSDFYVACSRAKHILVIQPLTDGTM